MQTVVSLGMGATKPLLLAAIKRRKSMLKIQILGTGCAKCEKLAKHAQQAADNLGQEYELGKVTDLNEIMEFGVMTTPALVLDGKVVVTGKVPGVKEVEKLLQK
jgi:small redox-active disulfide protein 2